MADDLDAGREALARRRWGDAYARLASAERASPLAPDDYERLALAAYMTGDEEAAADGWTKAHQAWLSAGDPARAARCAFWHACGLMFRGEIAPAMGWIARGGRVLEGRTSECAEQAWLMALTELPKMFMGDTAAAHPRFVEAAEIAQRCGDKDVLTLCLLAQGQALVMMGQVSAGVRLLDEVMASVTAGEVHPIASGIAYCAVISACQDIFDLRRANEWTAALSRWSDAQTDLVPFRGNCLVHRCEIMQLQGDWPEALEAAEEACELLSDGTWDVLGAAYYQLGEIQRSRGDFSNAEESYRRASAAGREPEPGMTLLRLAQGRVGAAATSIRRVVDQAGDPPSRSRVLPAYVEVMIAADEPRAAREAADELGQIAEQLDAPYLHTVAGHATGAVLVAEGDGRAALTTLRAVSAAWRDLDTPHAAARSRVLAGLACRLLGDHDAAALEFDAARRAFVELGALPDIEDLDRLVGAAAVPIPGGLTAREVEVLRLVASGKTNRAIATELVLSEKTVARHLSNIFTKLGLSSRSAATAYAYEHDLV